MGVQDGDVLTIHYDAPRSSEQQPEQPSEQPSTSPSEAALVDVHVTLNANDEIEDVSFVVKATTEGELKPPSGSTTAQDCQPGTSHGAKQEEELKKSSGNVTAPSGKMTTSSGMMTDSSEKKQTASKKKADLPAMLPTSSAYDQLSYKDQLTYLRYYKENGFTAEELQWLNNYNPEFAETVLNART